MDQIVYIQKYIYKYNNCYVIKDVDLNKLLNINVIKVIKKYKKFFNIDYYFKINDNYLIKKEGIGLISIIINSYYLIDKICYILDTFEFIEIINYSTLKKISQKRYYINI